MRERTHTQKRLLCIAFALMAVLAAGILPLGLHHGGGIRVGVLRSAHAYGTAMLLQTRSAQYHAVLRDEESVLVDALLQGELDAAVIGYDAAAQAGLDIHAVLGHTNLWCVSAEPLWSIEELAGRTVMLPERLRGTREERMLLELLRAAGVRCELAYAENGDILFLDLDSLDAYLLRSAGTQVCFALGQEWRRIKNNVPPAGLCLAVRSDLFAQLPEEAAAFESALHSSVLFTGEKTKKACAMAAAAGLAVSEAEAVRRIGRISFVYLTGPEMSASLHALR